MEYFLDLLYMAIIDLCERGDLGELSEFQKKKLLKIIDGSTGKKTMKM